MNKAMEWLTVASAIAAISQDQCLYRFDHGRRSSISKQAQADRKKRNKAAARARKRNRG